MMMSMSPMMGRSGFGGGGVSPASAQPPTPHQTQIMQIPVSQPPGGSLSLALLIDFIVQKTYNELTVMADLLPRKTDMERKHDIFNFSSRTRMLATRLLALVKWASSAAKVDKSVHIMSFLEKQSILFTDTADVLARIARETLVHARLPNFHIPAAVEILTTGSYSRLPNCIRERIVPPDPISAVEKKSTLNKLNQVIQHRLVTSELPSQMRNLRIENGRVTFVVEREFEVSLTVLGDSPSAPWRLLGVEVLVEDRDIGDGLSLVHPLQLDYLQKVAQERLLSSPSPLHSLYSTLHFFSTSLQLEVLYTQALKLCRERLGEYLTVEEYVVGQSLLIGYWNELSSSEPKAELGYRLLISTDSSSPSSPLTLSHFPPLPLSPQYTNSNTSTTSNSSSNITSYSPSNNSSNITSYNSSNTTSSCSSSGREVGGRVSELETLLVQTVFSRCWKRLEEMKKEIEESLRVRALLGGSPPFLSLPLLKPSLPSEELIITVNIQTGAFIVHIPQFETNPSTVSEIEELLNSPNRTLESLKPLISKLRIWLAERRIEKTLQHLPASASDGISLVKWEENRVLKKIGPNRLTIKFLKHSYAILIVELKEREESSCEIEYGYYLAEVRKSGADEENEISSSDLTSSLHSPKFYLRPTSVLQLSPWLCTHGPYSTPFINKSHSSTQAEAYGHLTREHVKPGDEEMGKSENVRKRKKDANEIEEGDESGKRREFPPDFIGELAHIVALLDERLPFSMLLQELSRRSISYIRKPAEGQGVLYALCILEFGCSLNGVPQKYIDRLHERLESAVLRTQVQLKGFRTWNFQLLFNSNNSTIGRIKEAVNFAFDMTLSSEDHFTKVVENVVECWHGIAKLYMLLERSNWLSKLSQQGIVHIHSFTWNKLVVFYGPGRIARANIIYSNSDKCYKIYFGGLISHNPHTLLRPHLQSLLNSSSSSLSSLFLLLHHTYDPLASLSKLPSSVSLGSVQYRPQLPIQTFVVVGQSGGHVRVVYNGTYCLDVKFQREGLVSVRDGAYSMFNKNSVLGDLTPTQGLKAFLSKYVDESAVFRRRSQSEDDNPPSPISTLLELEHGGGGNGPGSSSSFLSNKPQSPAGTHRSNPHTPASPHLQTNPTGYSPATSFANLSSPPSLPHLSQPCPSPMGGSSSTPHLPPHHPPSLPVPSPSSGPLSVPTPSPNPGGGSGLGPGSAPTLLLGGGGGGHASPFFAHSADVQSPAGGGGVQSPWGGLGGSPLPRPSPLMRHGHSPGGSGSMGVDGSRMNIANRTLPQRSWAGAIPTILTHEALDILCTPVTSVDNGVENDGSSKGYPCSPLERFLGCSNLRRQLQRIVQTEHHLTVMQSAELGVLLFKSDTMIFRVGLDPTNFQSLHLKISQAPDSQFQWTLDEFTLLETFFSRKVVSPPFRPNGLAAFARLLTLPPRIIRDIVGIIRLSLFPSIGMSQGWKWGIQLCLTVPPAALPIIAPGMPAVVISDSKFLLFFLLTKSSSSSNMDIDPPPPNPSLDTSTCTSIVAPLIHELGTNVTQLAEKRSGPVAYEFASLSHHIKRFTDMCLPPLSSECSLLPILQDVLMNFSVGGEGGGGGGGGGGMGMGGPMMQPQMSMVRPPMQQMMSPASQFTQQGQVNLQQQGPMM